jgi:hypothetical protein
MKRRLWLACLLLVLVCGGCAAEDTAIVGQAHEVGQNTRYRNPCLWAGFMVAAASEDPGSSGVNRLLYISLFKLATGEEKRLADTPTTDGLTHRPYKAGGWSGPIRATYICATSQAAA